MKSKSTTVLLAFFLGAFGAHRFYLGQIGLGVTYLLFCWTFIPAIIAIIDFFGFLFMSEEKFNRKYNGTNEIAVVAATPNNNNNVNTVAINMGGPIGNATVSASEEIVKLFELKEKGIITQEEFDLKKKTIL